MTLAYLPVTSLNDSHQRKEQANIERRVQECVSCDLQQRFILAGLISKERQIGLMQPKHNTVVAHTLAAMKLAVEGFRYLDTVVSRFWYQ